MNKMIVLRTDHGELLLEQMDDGRIKLFAKPNSPHYFVNRSEFTSNYPIELIERILDVKGLDYVCDEIARDEDPRYLSLDFETGLFAFLEKDAIRNKRLLDFGCGGALRPWCCSAFCPKPKS